MGCASLALPQTPPELILSVCIRMAVLPGRQGRRELRRAAGEGRALQTSPSPGTAAGCTSKGLVSADFTPVELQLVLQIVRLKRTGSAAERVSSRGNGAESEGSCLFIK